MTWGVGARPPRQDRPMTHRVIMSFHFEQGWRIAFFDDDRRRSALSRRAFCHDDETLLDFIRRAGGVKGSDMRVYLEAALKRQREGPLAA